jgi:hypothetical protein
VVAAEPKHAFKGEKHMLIAGFKGENAFSCFAKVVMSSDSSQRAHNPTETVQFGLGIIPDRVIAEDLGHPPPDIARVQGFVQACRLAWFDISFDMSAFTPRGQSRQGNI